MSGHFVPGKLGLGALFTLLLSSGLTACAEDDPLAGCTESTRTYTDQVIVSQSAFDDGMMGGALNCAALCSDAGVESCREVNDTTGMLEPGEHLIECRSTFVQECEGRRHLAVEVDRIGWGRTEVAAWLARAAVAEAASVSAFTLVAEELHAHGAPDSLISAARRAAVEETRHAEAMGRHARAAGALPPPKEVPVGARPERSLFAFALENAVEGCVKETFAGLVARHQARHARDPDLRETMATISAEEVGHGELSWQIHAWACTRLSREEVDRIHAAMGQAVESLIATPRTGALSPRTRTALGLPSPVRAAQLARALATHLWSREAFGALDDGFQME